MNLLLLSGGGGASLPSSHRCSIKFIHPIPPLFSSISNHAYMPKIRPKPTALASADPGASRPTAAPTSTPLNAAGEDAISSVTQDRVPLAGVIQNEKPNSSSSISKWGKVALLAGGDVAALLLLSAAERFSHGFEVFDFETLRTADPFIVGWFLSASFLGGYGEDGRGMNGLSKACIAATKSCALGILLGLVLRAATVDHIPPVNFVTVTMGSAAILLIGWRTLLFSILPDDQKKTDVYKRGSPLELFEMSHNSTRQYHDNSTFRHHGRHREESSILEPSAENLKVPPSLSPLQPDRHNSLGMSNGYIEQPNIIPTPMFTPEWQTRAPHSPESIESPVDGPSRGTNVSRKLRGTNHLSRSSDVGNTRNEPSKVPLEWGRELITPAGKKGFYPAKANCVVMVCIKKYFTKAVKTYREASLELKEVWFNEFKKRYTWREEHNDDIRCNFDAKASFHLSMAFSRIRKARLKNKPPPKWISPEIYKDLEKLWDQDFDDTRSEQGRELITPVGEKGFYPAKANRAIMGCIKKHFTKAVKSYRKAPPELKEVWFNEFKKRYIWREEHNTNIRRNFDAKASNQLRNTLFYIRKARWMNKPPPKWISPEIYRDLEKLWDKDFGDIRSEPSKVTFEQGRELITPVGEKGFYPAKANRAIMGCIKKHFTKAVKSYREAPPELKEVWFNEFRKRYIWREEHNTNIRRNFDAKASDQLRNTLTDIRKARRMNKPPPNWISPEIYKDLEQLWDDPKYIAKCEILKQAQNTVHVDDRPSSLYMDGSIPMSKPGQELITLDGKGGFHPAKVNGAIMGCIKKHFTKAVKTYHEAPLELKEVWFNEFRKMYIWKEEDNTNIRRTFDAKASNQLLNNLIHIRKRWLKNKSPPKWISPEIYKDLEQLWYDSEFISK